MDIGVNLVENYLRLTGYLTLSEFEVQRRLEPGIYETVTDVDVLAVRFPGDVYVGDPHNPDSALLLIEDPELRLQPDCVDVIIGEVKQGEASINPGLLDHRTLHAVLQRMDWVYDEALDAVVSGLQDEGMHLARARGGGLVRTRIIAFGQGPGNSHNVITHAHILETLLGFFDRFEDAFRPLQFKDPAPALLRLLNKAGFDVRRTAPGPPPGRTSADPD